MNARFKACALGCLLGTAVGDALGAPVEFMDAHEIVQRFGPEGVMTLEPWGGHPAGSYTDDTQMTLATTRGIIRSLTDGVDTADATWTEYLAWLETQDDPGERRGPGTTCLAALRGGTPGDIEGPVNESKGCGGIMRVAPVGLVFEPGRAFELGAVSAALTHGHPSGYLAAGFLADVVSRAVRGTASLYRAIEEAREELLGWDENDEVLAAVDGAVEFAMTAPGTRLRIERLGEGWVAEEALAISLACALAYPEDWTGAVLVAVNHGGDSDSTGAITGALLGAYLGADAIPLGWTEKVEDVGEIFVLADGITDLVTDEAEHLWIPGEL